MTDEQNGRRLKTVETSLLILETLQEHDGCGVTELADHLGLAPSTVHGHLATMENNGYLVKEGDRYYLSLTFLNKGRYAQRRTKAYRLAIDHVNALAEETQEKAQFVVEEHGRSIYLHTSQGSHAVNIDTKISVGSANSLHVGASGKAILAHLPQHRVSEIVERTPLEEFTPNTITDPDELLQELADIRERGYSFSREEFLPGLCAVGVPVSHQNGQVIGGLSVSGPSERFKGSWFESDLPELLLGAANELELNTAYATQ